VCVTLSWNVPEGSKQWA